MEHGLAAPRIHIEPTCRWRRRLNPGWWENLIGPGRAIDTDRYFVVTPNMLGSAYGTTGPQSINPDTGKPYGPAFPEITTRDMIEAHCRLLAELGAKELAAVVGYSYGGYLTFQWGVTYPERMRSLVAVATGITGRGDESTVHELERHFEAAAGWNGVISIAAATGSRRR